RSFHVTGVQTCALPILLKFSEQAGIQVLTSTDALTDLDAPAIRGRMAPNDALAMLLKGTNLKFHSVGGNAIAIGNGTAQTEVGRSEERRVGNDCKGGMP